MKLANLAYIELETVLTIHSEQLMAYGGQDGIRDHAGLASAVVQPQAGFGDHEFYPTAFDKAAVYAHGISQSQAFVDGNKRTGLAVAMAFLTINGYPIVGGHVVLHDSMIKIANKEIGREELAEIFRNLCIDSMKT